MQTAEEEQVRRIEDLVKRVEEIGDLQSRETALALMESILTLHGTGLDRIMDILFEAGEPGKSMIRRLAGDKLVASLLILHDLHPDDIETRVHHVLSKLHGNAELMGVFDGVVRVRLTGSGCGLKQSVESAIRDAVPDAGEIVIEESAPLNSFIPLSSLVTAPLRDV